MTCGRQESVRVDASSNDMALIRLVAATDGSRTYGRMDADRVVIEQIVELS